MPRAFVLLVFLAVPIATLASSCGVAGCRSQPASCKAYVVCAEATGATKGSLDGSYGAMGTCWTSNDDVANACDRQCQLFVLNLIIEHPEAECRAK